MTAHSEVVPHCVHACMSVFVCMHVCVNPQLIYACMCDVCMLPVSAHTYSVHVSSVQCVGSTTRLPSHCAQVKETRKSLYDSESGVKKMAVGHHLGERSHTIE